MRPVSLYALGIVALLTSESVRAQTPGGFGVQANVGLALRDVPAQSFAAGEGAQGLGRVLIPLNSQFRVFSEVSLTSFATRQATVPGPGPCPIGTLCPAQLRTAPGPRITSLALGLQRLLNAGPMSLELSALAGGAWLSRRAPGSTGTAFSLGAAAGFLFPGSRHLRPMLEARAVRLFTSAANPRWVGGVALGVAVQ